MRMMFHMSMSIAGAIKNFKRRSMKGLLVDENGREMSNTEVRAYLAECQAKGWKKIPCGQCEGFNHFGDGCPGHPIPDEIISNQINNDRSSNY